MTEAKDMLSRKTNELEATLTEVQGELERADGMRQSETHSRLAETVAEARAWLDGRAAGEGAGSDGDSAAADTRRAEAFLHEIRMHRGDL